MWIRFGYTWNMFLNIIHPMHYMFFYYWYCLFKLIFIIKAGIYLTIFHESSNKSNVNWIKVTSYVDRFNEFNELQCVLHLLKILKKRILIHDINLNFNDDIDNT